MSTILSGETTTFDANNMTPKIAERKLNTSINSVGDSDEDDEQVFMKYADELDADDDEWFLNIGMHLSLMYEFLTVQV